MCITKACADPTSPGVWWRDDAKWKQYDAAMATAIQQGLADRANRVKLGNLVSSKYARGALYVVDLCSMKQINVATGFTRDVKVVKAPAAKVPAAPVNAWDVLIFDLAKEIIVSLKEMVMKLLAVKLLTLKNEANQGPVKVTSPDHVVSVIRGL